MTNTNDENNGDLDYYETLGVRPAASADEITQAYRQLARRYHPDANSGGSGDASAAARFKEINAAYQALSDPQQRAQYDAERVRGAPDVVDAEVVMTPDNTPPDDLAVVYEGSVTLHGAEIQAALDELRSALSEAVSETADELRGALRGFAGELDAIARAGGDVNAYRARRPGLSPSLPQRRRLPKRTTRH